MFGAFRYRPSVHVNEYGIRTLGHDITKDENADEEGEDKPEKIQ
jgi:hypothetical protein